MHLVPGLVSCLLAAALGAQTFTSGVARVHLLELYTSQGCSSCPPADRYVAGLAEHPGLWRDFVPVAFHVTYWDRLGWPDPFAMPGHSHRQYAVADAAGARVYTPGMFLDGVEWTSWRKGQLPPPAKASAGLLQATLENGRLAASFDQPGTWTLHVAILGNGLLTRVERGENARRQLAESFVVLGYATQASATGQWELVLPTTIAAAPTRQALALWVSREPTTPPLQATGGWLPRAAE